MHIENCVFLNSYFNRWTQELWDKIIPSLSLSVNPTAFYTFDWPITPPIEFAGSHLADQYKVKDDYA